MAEEDRDNLESLISKSLKENPRFESSIAASFGKRQQTPEKTLVERLLPFSAAFANAALSFPGNPFYTPVAVGGITYLLAKKALNLAAGSKRFKGESIRQSPSNLHDRIFTILNPLLSAASAAFAFYISFEQDRLRGQIQVDTSFLDSGLVSIVPLLPSHTPELAYAAITGASAYIILSGIERLIHSQSLSTLAHLAAAKFYAARKRHKEEANHLELAASMPHSKRKEAAILLQVGAAYLQAGQADQAFDTYKRLIKAATRSDDFAGVSDWLIKAGKSKRSHLRSNSTDSNSSGVHAAMHYFLNGDLEEANTLLAEAIAAEPRNRQLHRIRALFFEATRNDALAGRVMAIYVQLLKADPSMSYRLVGESRNEVFVPKDESTSAPDIFIKRNTNKSPLEEEVENVRVLSTEQLARPIWSLPRIIRQGEEGEHHEIVIESMGNATKRQKAMNGTLTHSDVRATLDLLVNTVISVEELRKQGKIKVHEPMTAETYTYPPWDYLKEHGVNPAQPNISDGRVYYFAHWVTDTFLLGVQQYNGVNFPDKFSSAVMDGALVLSSMMLEGQQLNLPYTDFTDGNLIFATVFGNLEGKIDFEKIRILPFLWEVVNVLESYPPTLGSVGSRGALEYVLGKLESGLQMRLDMAGLKRRYQPAAVIRNLGLVGYRSRDTAHNPLNANAQVYHYLMAQMHLVNSIRSAGKETKPVLEEMLAELEATPILKDKEQQQQIESEIRRQIIPDSAYVLHELTSRKYWLGLAKSFWREGQKEELKSPWPPWRRVTLSNSGLIENMSFLIGLPFIAVTATATGIPIYYVMQRIMPSL